MLRGVPGSSPITDPRLRPKRTRSEGPFLRQHYPASTVVWPSPTPVRPAACASWGAASPSRDGSPPMTRITLPTCRAPYPGGSRRVPVSIASPLTRPSPFPRRVGIRIFTFEMLWGGRWRDVTIVAGSNAMERPMAQQLDDLSRSLTPLEQDSTIIAVIEMSQASWLVAGIVPGIERHPLKKLEPSEGELLRLLMRWRAEATQNGRTITRIAVAFEAGRDGFWLARWLRARDIEAYVIHPTSVAVSREHRRAKTDRLDTGLLKRVFIGWLRGEPDHCHMAAIPTLAEEDAKRPGREREGLVRERTRLVNRMKGCLVRFGVRTFKPTLRNAPTVSQHFGPPRVCRSRPTRCSNCVATWPACGSSWTRSKRSSRPVRKSWNGLLRTRRMSWFVSSRALWASAWRPRTCWFMRFLPGPGAIDEPSPAMRA